MSIIDTNDLIINLNRFSFHSIMFIMNYCNIITLLDKIENKQINPNDFYNFIFSPNGIAESYNNLELSLLGMLSLLGDIDSSKFSEEEITDFYFDYKKSDSNIILEIHKSYSNGNIDFNKIKNIKMNEINRIGNFILKIYNRGEFISNLYLTGIPSFHTKNKHFIINGKSYYYDYNNNKWCEK